MPWQSKFKIENAIGEAEKVDGGRFECDESQILVHFSDTKFTKLGSTEKADVLGQTSKRVCASFLVFPLSETGKYELPSFFKKSAILKNPAAYFEYHIPAAIAKLMTIFVKNGAKANKGKDYDEVAVQLGCGGYIEFVQTSAPRIMKATRAKMKIGRENGSTVTIHYEHARLPDEGGGCCSIQ